MESRLEEVSKEACMDRELRKKAEASARTFKERYESREEEIGDLKKELESVRATLKKTTDDLESCVKEKEQELYEKEFLLCNMQVGSCAVREVGAMWLWLCIEVCWGDVC